MSIPLRVLIVEDNPSDSLLMVAELRDAGFEAAWQRVETEAEFIAQLDTTPDVILSDYNLPQFGGLQALRLLRERSHDIPFIIVTGTVGEDVAVAAIREGASDYLLKDRLGRLGEAVKRAFRDKQDRDEKRLAERAMRHREIELRLILDTALDPFMGMDSDGRIIEWNRRAETTFGWSRAQAIGRPVSLTLVPSRDRHARDRTVSESAEKVAGSAMLTGLHRDGREFPVEVTIWPVVLDQTCSHYAFVRDVTERVNAQRRLMVQHAVTSVLAASPSLDVVMSQYLQAICQNLDWEVGTQWRLDPGKQGLECAQTWCQPTVEAAAFEAFTRAHAFEPGTAILGDVWISGQAVWVAQIADLPQDPRTSFALKNGLYGGLVLPIVVEKQVIGVLEFFWTRGEPVDEDLLRTVTALGNQLGQFVERKRAEESLKRSNQQMSLLIDTSPLAIVGLDAEINVRIWNRAAEEIFGWTEAEVLGCPAPMILPDTINATRSRIEENLQGTTADLAELSAVRKDGAIRNLNLWTAPLRDQSGEIVGSLGFLADVTDRKRLEEQLRQSQKMEAIGRLTGGIAHDFNNILTVIIGFSSLSLDELRPGDPLQEFVEEIRTAGLRAATLTRQLLAFSRKQVLVAEVLDVNTHLAEMEKMFRRLIGEDIHLRLCCDPNLWPVKADPGQLEQVIMNLVVNARDAMPTGGKLTLETSNVELDETYVAAHPEARVGNYVRVAVSDSGCGMDRATQAHIFEPFFTTKSPEKGTGLGLSTVYGIVKQTGGHVEVYSEPGLGTSFKIYLPGQEGAVGSAAHKETRPAARGLEKVLLVEDEAGVRRLARQVLEHYGYQVLEARHPQEALLMCQNQSETVDLLVTDIVMPDMNGSQLAERLRALCPQVKVLFLSGYTDEAILHHGIIEADTPFLQKPFTPDALARKVREVIDSTN